MNTNILEGKWHQWKGSVKAQWGRLTNDEVDQIEGNVERLIGLVQERYGYEQKQAEDEVNEFISRYEVTSTR